MLKRNAWRTAFLAVAALVCIAATMVLAEPAIVVKDGELCILPGADADGNIIEGGLGVATTIVENGNKVTVKCKGENITNLSGKAQSFRGFRCFLVLANGDEVITTDTHATVSASGIGTLTCTYKKP